MEINVGDKIECSDVWGNKYVFEVCKVQDGFAWFHGLREDSLNRTYIVNKKIRRKQKDPDNIYVRGAWIFKSRVIRGNNS